MHIFQTTFLEIAVHVLCLRLTQDPGNHTLFSGTYLPRMNKGVFVPTNRLDQRGWQEKINPRYQDKIPIYLKSVKSFTPNT